jgi:hypothetical protein
MINQIDCAHYGRWSSGVQSKTAIAAFYLVQIESISMARPPTAARRAEREVEFAWRPA